MLASSLPQYMGNATGGGIEQDGRFARRDRAFKIPSGIWTRLGIKKKQRGKKKKKRGR